MDKQLLKQNFENAIKDENERIKTLCTNAMIRLSGLTLMN